MDLCTLLNISVVIMETNFVGYYIHGKNPLGKVEGDFEVIYKTFKSDQANKTKQRGLIQNDLDQT